MTTSASLPPPVKSCWQSVAVVLVMLLAALAVMRWHRELPLLNPARAGTFPLMLAIDSESYLAMAKDGPSQIASPFTKRFLYPWLVGKVARITSQSFPNVFLELNLISLLVLSFCLAELLRTTVGQPLLALVLLLTPFPLECFELAYLPDLFHMAWIAAFFLLLARQKERSALVILFLAFLSRENTMVLCLFTVGLAWFRGNKRLAVGAGIVLGAGLVASAFFSRLGKPNIHHLPDFLYLVGKIPYYFLLSCFGLRVWSNVRPGEGVPLVSWQLPSWLHIGSDKVVGLAYPDWHYPMSTLIIWLTVFGVGPLVLFYLLRKTGKTSSLPIAVELALYYGAVSYLIGPFLGDWVDRLVGYGWPAFWIVMPYLFYSPRLQMNIPQIRFLPFLYVISCWWPRFFGYGNDRSVNPWPCFGVLIFFFATWAILRRVNPMSPSKVPEPVSS